MNNQELLDEINKWNLLFTSSTTLDKSIYELAFFKIFIKFEKFLSDCFENYAIGLPSSFGYSPARKLNFDDLGHLHKVIKKDNQLFVNHYDIIKRISDCFFVDNPFEIIKTDPTHSTNLSKMKVLRDFIAHESNSARNKYEINVLNNRPFKEPHEHLLERVKNKSYSHYTNYINSIIDISNFIINDPSLKVASS